MKYNENVNVNLLGRKGIILEDLWIRTKIFGRVFAFIVPKGFETDFATIPRLFWSIFAPTDDDIYVGAIGHDLVYENKGEIIVYLLVDGKLLIQNEPIKIIFTRLQADLLLYEKMKSFGSPLYRRVIVFTVVRCFGWFFWYNVDKKIKKLYVRIKYILK